MSRPSGRTPDAALIAIRSPFHGVFPPGLCDPPGLARSVVFPTAGLGLALVPRVIRRGGLRPGAPAQVVVGLRRVARFVGLARQLRPDQQSGTVLVGAPGLAQGVDEDQAPAVLVLGLLIGRGVGLARGAALVAHGYADQVVGVVQLAHYVSARRVHDRVGHQLGDDQGRGVTGVLAHCPAAQPGPCQASGL